MLNNVRILNFPHGECHFQDCIEGMAKIPDSSFDLCITDPPYDANYKAKARGNGRKAYIAKKRVYEDGDIAKYWNLIDAFFEQIFRIAAGMIVTPGDRHLYEWITKHRPDYALRGWYKSNAIGFTTFDPILVYGHVNHMERMPRFFNIPSVPDTEGWIHPCPKSIELWKKIIRITKPSSVIDPFLGSGPTVEACEAAGIDWLGFEIDASYAVDIERRAALGEESCRISRARKTRAY